MRTLDRLAESFLGGAALERPGIMFATGGKRGGGSAKRRKDDDEEDDDEEDDDEEDDDEEDDDEEDDDDLADLTDDELRDELRKTRESLSKASGSSAAKRKRIKRLTAELADARKPKPATKPAPRSTSRRDRDDDREPVDVDAIKAEVKAEADSAANNKIKRAEARGALRAAGVAPERVAKAVGLLDLDDLDVDDDGEVDGLDDALDALKKEWPELFTKPKPKRRASVAGDSDQGGKSVPRRKMSATELQVAAALGKTIRK